MSESLYLWLIPLLPFAGFLVNGLAGRRLPKWTVTAVALAAPLGAFVAVLRAAAIACASSPSSDLSVRSYTENLGTWFNLGALHIDFSLTFDALTLVMLLVVTGVGFVIHIYSVGYMHDDEGYARYFSYLNLFLFFMTVLVLAGNALVMFIGWEGVGLASYLLIGFWFEKKSAADAGKKAFLVNRIGDFGFLIGIFLLAANFGSLEFAEIGARLTAAPNWNGGVLTVAALCLMVGAAGKSAQLPLYVWLPDAMEGPTPVSALIHAATMVTAGVYMVARTHVLFNHSPFALGVVAVVGAATALFAATMALVQNDIKRVLAYSTISQLGYMFLACGVAAYSAGVFHLMTHAFFKALLFLAAGAVIHSIDGEQDLRKMGGLWNKMPLTFTATTIGVLAISGVPPLAGFYSKDAIIEATLEEGPMGVVLGCVGLLIAVLTTLYMFRMWYLAFLGRSRGNHTHPHKTPWSMSIPLILLSLLSICGGWIGMDRFHALLQPVFGMSAVNEFGAMPFLIVLTVVLAALGWGAADLLYRLRPHKAQELTDSYPLCYKILTNKYYVDEFYQSAIVKPLLRLSKYALDWVVDRAILGGLIWLLAGVANFAGMILQRWQSGNLRSYAAWLTVGAAALLLFVFFAHVWIPTAVIPLQLPLNVGGR